MKIYEIVKNNLVEMLKKPMTRVTLFAVALIPLLYSGLYLWAFWNPYVRMNKLPVGIVNLDSGTGSITQKQRTQYGKKLVDALLESDSMNWKIMTQEHARKAMDEGEIYFYLMIPRDFSESLTSAASDKPKKAELEFVVNESKNVLIPQIGGKVVEEVRRNYSKEVTKHVASVLLEAGKSAAGGISEAAKGAGELSRGVDMLVSGTELLTEKFYSAMSGSNSLAEGITAMAKGSATLENSVTAASQGAHALSVGLSDALAGTTTIRSGLAAGVNQVDGAARSLEDAAVGASKVAGGAQSVADGSARIADNLEQLRDGLSRTNDGAARLSASLDAAAASVAKLSQNPLLKAIPEVSKLAAQAQEAAKGAAALKEALASSTAATSQLAEGSAKVAEGGMSVAGGAKVLSDSLSGTPSGVRKLGRGLSDAVDGLDKVGAGLTRLQTGAAGLDTGLVRIRGGALSLSKGLVNAQAGSSKLTSGLTQLAAGEHKLDNGLSELNAGTETLAAKLSEGASLVKGLESEPNLVESKAEVIAEPIDISNVRINPVDTYGTGFAPYFLSLSLWVGALLLFFAVNTKVPGADLSTTSRVKVLFSKFVVIAGVAALQGVFSCGVVHKALHMPVSQVTGYYLLGILTSVSFAAILYFLVAGFGMAGRFMGIVILMLQLTSCGGTFPPETLPTFFQHIKPWLPMTYSVQGFRMAISTVSGSSLSEAVKMLAVYALVFLALTPFVTRKDIKNNELCPVGEKLIPEMSSENA